MDWLSSLGPVLVAVIVYVIARIMRRYWSRTPRPSLLAALAFILATLPSIIPRIVFHGEVMDAACQPSTRIVGYMYFVGADPATWVWSLHSATLLMPETSPSSGFRWTKYSYGESTSVQFVEPDCKDLTIHWSRRDLLATVLNATDKPRKMADGERRLFCTDSAKEDEARLKKKFC